MNTIIMIFALPLGLYLLSKEGESRRNYESVFSDFYSQTKADTTLTKEQKIDRLKEMLYQNGYEVTQDEKTLIGKKKIFSIAWMTVGIGLAYIGLLLYILYFLYFQKPHIVTFNLEEI